MIFSTSSFLVFLVCVLAVVKFTRSETQRRYALFIASVVFYGWWDWRFCGFLFAASIIDYRLALKIREATGRQGKRRWLLCSLTLNLGILAAFKYSAWLVASLNTIAGLDLAIPEVPLPLGISFFTFQAMSYTIDVYRGHFDPTHRWFDFAFSMSFFPHLIAGPIVRAAHLMPQLDQEHPLTEDNVVLGLARFTKGFIKETMFADQMAVCADTVFANPAFYSSGTVWLGVLAYTFQIYYDFSGYTDMAIGLARMFGYDFPENFDHPYLSSNITEFWRRWHISLSSWLRDYLYISLGGNRKGRARTYVNLALTMLLGGLWHGANWTFVAWGALHGAALAFHKWVAERWPTPGWYRRVFGPPLTFLFVTISWVPFRATSFEVAWTILRKMSGMNSEGCQWPYVQAIVALVIAVAAHWYVATGRQVQLDLRRPLTLVVIFAVLSVGLLYAPALQNPFIYFQF